MQSKTSLFNKEIIKQDLRSVGWVGIVYFLGIFFALPLQMIMLDSKDFQYQHYLNSLKTLFSVQFEIQVLFLTVLPVLLGILLFRYLQIKQSNDFIHSLPIKRSSLYFHHSIFGILILLIPIILNGLILTLLNSMLGLEELFTFQDILYWCGMSIVVSGFFFISSVFIGMFTGLSAAQGVLTYIMILLPVGLLGMLVFNLKHYLYGFPYDYYMNSKLEQFSLLIRAFESSHDPYTITEAIVYSIIGVVLFLISMVIYQKRKLETSSQAIVFTSLRPVFKYGVTFCTMLFGGLYFGDTQNSMAWMIFGYVVGSLIGYFVAEMVLDKTWRVFSKWKGFIIYAVVISALIGVVQIDLFGYEERVPDIDQVERVYFGDSFYKYTDPEWDKTYFEKKETIKYIYSLHQKLIETNSQLSEGVENVRNVSLVYELKNGKKLVRSYQLPETLIKTIKEFKPLYESKEYKEIRFDVLGLDIQSIDKITLNARGVHKSVTITDSEEIKEMTEILKQDIYEQSFDDIMSKKEPWAYIDFLLENDERAQAVFSQSYQGLEEWLKAKGYYENARVLPEDISYIKVIKAEESVQFAMRTMHYQDILDTFNEHPNMIKITENEQIGQILTTVSYFREGLYWVAIYYKGQSHADVFGFSDGEIPEFIINQFENK